MGIHRHVRPPARILARSKGTGTAKRANRSSAKKRSQDINVWLQCYAIIVGVMATKSPEMVPELMAYMISILQASQEYEGLAWATYEAAYHQQAAATGHKQWSKVNPSLYTVCFTGKARKAIPDATYASAQLTRHQSVLWQWTRTQT